MIDRIVILWKILIIKNFNGSYSRYVLSSNRFKRYESSPGGSTKLYVCEAGLLFVQLFSVLLGYPKRFFIIFYIKAKIILFLCN